MCEAYVCAEREGEKGKDTETGREAGRQREATIEQLSGPAHPNLPTPLPCPRAPAIGSCPHLQSLHLGAFSGHRSIKGQELM